MLPAFGHDAPPFCAGPHEAGLRWQYDVPLKDFDAHCGSADSGQVALIDYQDVTVQSVGEQLRQLGFVTESATDGGRYTRRSALRRSDSRLSGIQTFALRTRAIGTCATAGRRIIVRPAATLLKKGIP